MVGTESFQRLLSLFGVVQNFFGIFFEKRTEHRYSLQNLLLIGI